MVEMPNIKLTGIRAASTGWRRLFVRAVLLVSVLSCASYSYAAQDVLLVLDNSGSMKKNDPEFLATAAINQFIESLTPETRAGVIIFDQRVTLAVPLTEAGGPNTQLLKNSLDDINYRGQLTDSPAAVERAIYELKTNGRPGADKFIVFMTDGIVDTGNAAADVEKTKWLREELAVDAADNGIKVLSLAFTENADFFLIQSLAKKTGGDYFRALTPADLPDAFVEIQARIAANDTAPAPVAEVEPSVAPETIEQTPPTLVPDDSPPQPAAVDEEPSATSSSDEDLLAQISPEDMEALKEISEIEGIPIEQLARELYGSGEEAADSTGVVVSRPGEAPMMVESEQLPPPEEDTLIPLVVAALGLLGLVVLVVWLIRRKSGGEVTTKDTSQATPAPVNDAPPAFLHDISGLAQEPLVNLDAQTLMIGRVAGSPDEHLKYLVVNAPTVGRRHALIKYKDKAYWLQDQGSVNGTYINDKRLSGECQLRHADRIRFHNAEFEFTQPDIADAGETMIGEALPGEATLVADATVLGTAAFTGGASADNGIVVEESSPEDAEAAGMFGDAEDASAEGDLTLDGSDDEMLAQTALPEGASGETDSAETPIDDIFDVTGEDAIPAIESDDDDFSEDQTELNTSELPAEVEKVLDTTDGDDMAATAMLDADDMVESAESSGEPTFGGVVAAASDEIDEEFDAEASAFFDDITVGPVADGEAEPDLTNTNFDDDSATFSVDGSDAHDLDQQALDERLERARELAEAADDAPEQAGGGAESPATEKMDVSHMDTMLNMEAPTPEDPNDVTLDDFIETDTFKSPLTQAPAAEEPESVSLDKFVETSALDAASAQETMVMDNTEASDGDEGEFGETEVFPQNDGENAGEIDDDASAFFGDDDTGSEDPTEAK